MPLEQCQAIARTELRRCNEIIKARHDVSPFPLQVKWDLTGTRAGVAVGGHEVRFNLSLLAMQSAEDVQEVAAHEIAHCAINLIDQREYRAWFDRNPGLQANLGDPAPATPLPHGWEWKTMMRVLGHQPKTTHAFDVTGFRQEREKFIVRCGCKEHKVGAMVLRRIKLGKKYTCRSCRRELKCT